MADEKPVWDPATLAKVKAAVWTNFGSGWFTRPLGSRWFFASFKGADGKRFDLPEPFLADFTAFPEPEMQTALVEFAKQRPTEEQIGKERAKLANYAKIARLADEKEASKAAIVWFWETVAPFAGIVMPIFLPATIQTVYNGIVGGDYVAAPGKALAGSKEAAKVAIAAAMDVGQQAVIGAAKAGTLLPVLLVMGLLGGGFAYFKLRK